MTQKLDHSSFPQASLFANTFSLETIRTELEANRKRLPAEGAARF
jgi:hypothetical protein